MVAPSDCHAGYLLRTPVRHLAVRSIPPALLVALLGGAQLYVDYLVAAYTLPIAAVAAVSASQPLQYLVFAMEALLVVGTANTISARIGRGASHERHALAATLNQLTLGAGVLLALSAPVLIPVYHNLVALDGPVAAQAASYLTVLLAGSVLLFAAAARLSLLQAVGRMGSVFGALAAGTFVNAFASLAAVGWLELGILGVALGTLAGHLVCAASAEYALRRAGLGMPLALAGADSALRRQILRVGHSGTLLHVLFFVQTAAMFRAVGVHGDSSDAAVLGAAFRIVMLGVYLVTGVARAMQPALAASHAAGLAERTANVLRDHHFAAFALMGVLMLPIVLHPQWVLALMLPGHSASADDLTNFRTYALILPALPVLLLGLTRLQATGRSPLASLLALLRLFALLPLLHVTTGMFGIAGIYASLLLTEWLLVPIVLACIRRPAAAAAAPVHASAATRAAEKRSS